MTEATKTLCPYCGVGCGLEVLPPARPGRPVNRDSQGNPVWQTRGDRAHPSSKGQICIKGGTLGESLDKERLLYPMMRSSLDESFQRVSWDVALNRVVAEIRQNIERQGPDSIAM